MLIAVINQSSLVSNEQAEFMTKAIQIQLDLHVLPAWNLKSATIKFYSDVSKAPGHSWIITILDHSTQAGALGYHDLNNDKVDGYIFAEPVLKNGGVVLYDPANPQNVSVSSVLSHEVCEMVGDRFANQWVDGPIITANNRHYNSYALELCDPVEGDSYTIDVDKTLVSVSNFVFPNWFNPQAKIPENMPFDYLKKLSAPFTMTSGGYLIIRQEGNVHQIFGDKVHPDKQSHVKSNWYRR